jgi:hypothetical protein
LLWMPIAVPNGLCRVVVFIITIMAVVLWQIIIAGRRIICCRCQVLLLLSNITILIISERVIQELFDLFQRNGLVSFEKLIAATSCCCCCCKE